VVGNKAYVVRRRGERIYDFRHNEAMRAQDPALQCVLERVQRMEQEMSTLRANAT